MIRAIASDEVENVLAVAVASGLFEKNELDELRATLASYFAKDINQDHHWIAEADEELQGVAYFAPERMTDGTWNLYMIAVRRKQQGRGLGKGLIKHVEAYLAGRGARLLLVETAGTDDFENARMFYRNIGYLEEARIRDFYAPGTDKIVFRKQLQVSIR